MTVPGEESVDLTRAEQQFTAVYADHFKRLTRYLAVFLDRGELALAEDLAQDTFMTLWKRMTEGKLDLERSTAYGLVKLYGRRSLGAHFKIGRSHERSVDVGAPETVQLLTAQRHTYAYGAPELAPMVRELDGALDRMREASQEWRNLNKESARLRITLADGYRDHLGGLSGTGRDENERRAEENEAREDKALHHFRETCRRVGELRAAIEAVAGPNWQTGSNLPPSQMVAAGRSYSTDLTQTHCSRGHLLDRLNTGFSETGVRKCRACKREDGLKNKPRQTPEKKRMTIGEDVIERARELLTDPSLKHSIRSVSELLGVSEITLYRYFPGGVKPLRAAVLAGAGR